MASRIPLPPEAAAALARGEVVLAVKLVREATGLGLKEAHDAVRMHATGLPAAASAQSPGGFVFPDAATAAIARGDFIQAIAQLREANPWLDLKSAKDAVDSVRRGDAKTAHRGAMPARPRVPTVVHGDSGRNGWLLLVVAAAVAAFAWWWTGGG
jgi:ribosomal protein L7/L12